MTVKKTTTAKATATKKTKVKTTAVKTTKAKTPKAVLKKMTAAKKAAGKASRSAASKRNALAMKKKGLGIFAPKSLSAELAAICGGKTMPRTEVTKKIWGYIKKNKLSSGRTITPDSALSKVFPKKSFSMFEMSKMVSSHLK
jgi:chromatin remodeling complex protein RSC6